MRRVRIGAIGARPSAFNTVRYSEKMLEAAGITIEPVDLSEILGRVARMPDDDDPAQAETRRDQEATSPPTASRPKRC